MRSYINKNILAMAAIALGAVACQPEIENIAEPSKGSADFSKYVALGNSLTAGYADGALYADAQRTSYPSILAEQLEAVGGATEFKQPLVPEGKSIYVDRKTGSTSGKYVLVINPTTGSPAPMRTPGMTIPEFLGAPLSPGPFQNIGIPGAYSFHLVAPGYGNPANIMTGTANPFYVRVLSQSVITDKNTTVASYAAQQAPTFFSLWIGNNDILSYGLEGGVGETITPQAMFDAGIDGTIATLKAANPNIKGAIANIPSIQDIPYFNRVPWDQFVLSNAQATGFNQALVALVNPQIRASVRNAVADGLVAQDPANFPSKQDALDYLDNDPAGQALLSQKVTEQIDQLKAANIYPVFKEGRNGFVVMSDDSPLGFKQLTSSEKMLLPFATSGYEPKPQFGVIDSVAVADKYALDIYEVNAIESARVGYNSKIKLAAETHSLAHVDAAALLEKVDGGLTIDGVSISSTFVQGGAFSLDGIHLTPRGSAVVANEFIRSINAAYGANIPKTSPSQYEGVLLP